MEVTLELDLRLPLPEVTEDRLAYEVDAYRTVLRIYYQYLLLSRILPKLADKVENQSKQIFNYDRALALNKHSLEVCKRHTDYVHEVVNELAVDRDKLRRQAILRGLIIGGSGVLVGLGVGLLIGVFGI